MTPINKSNIAAFHALLNKHGLKDEKKNIVQELSGNRTSSTKDLYQEEILPWISAMNIKIIPKQEDPRQKMINKIIAIAREMGVIVRKAAVATDGKVIEKSDYSNFDKWMRERSYLKKPLKEYAYDELPKLVSQYNNLYESWLLKRRM